jgi:hypothetical protein
MTKKICLGILVFSLVLAVCSAETVVKDTFAGSTWSDTAKTGTFTFAKEGGTFAALSDDGYSEGSYKVGTMIEIVLEDYDFDNWAFIDGDKLSIDGTTFVKISGEKGIINTKWGIEGEVLIEFLKDSVVLYDSGQALKGTYTVAPCILGYDDLYEDISLAHNYNIEFILVLINDKLTIPGEDFFLTKETASPSINGVYELVSGDSYAASIELKSRGICVIKYSVGGGFSFQGQYTVEGTDVVMNLQGMLVSLKKVGNRLFSDAMGYDGVYKKQ